MAQSARHRDRRPETLTSGGPRNGLGAGSSLIEIDLIDKEGGTLLRMTHSGLPDAEERASHWKGWGHYLDRLAIAAAGGDPGPDTQ
jgi:uncharacterized protein YndB with AHSA1/START domain